MKIIFDATFGERWVEALRSFFQLMKEPRPKLLHLYDLFDRDVHDDIWIPALINQKCLIISADQGRGHKPRLPELCKKHKKTHILFSPTLLSKTSQFEKARAIVYLWPKISITFNDSHGSRFQIQATDGTHQSFSLIKK